MTTYHNPTWADRRAEWVVEAVLAIKGPTEPTKRGQDQTVDRRAHKAPLQPTLLPDPKMPGNQEPTTEGEVEVLIGDFILILEANALTLSLGSLNGIAPTLCCNSHRSTRM